ncbi:hypothetical protein N0V90_012815 [Kalmusia sp. IMI 367209]|nr:hypothetical protein N0V90_012815 [Kalmusia sp. IMI 367209]
MKQAVYTSEIYPRTARTSTFGCDKTSKTSHKHGYTFTYVAWVDNPAAPGSAITTNVDSEYIFFSEWDESRPELGMSETMEVFVDGIKYVNTLHYVVTKLTLYGRNYSLLGDTTARYMEGSSDFDWFATTLMNTDTDTDTWNGNITNELNKVNTAKASSSLECAKALMDTGDKMIMYAFTEDNQLSIGYSPREAIANKDNWGNNTLGKT